MLEKAIRDFCCENNYEILENYTGSTFFGETAATLAIVVKPDRNSFEILAQLTSYLDAKLEAKEIDDSVLEELEGANIDYADGGQAQIYFPWVKNYHPKE